MFQKKLFPIYVTSLSPQGHGALWLNENPTSFLPTTRLLISLNSFLTVTFKNNTIIWEITV